MKAILATSLSVIFAAVALTSCQSAADIDIATPGAPAASAVNAAKVIGIIPSTRANATASIKSEWTSEDWIYVNNGGKHSYFRANEEGSDASFSIAGSGLDWNDGVAYAAYPKSVKFTDGLYTMSFAGQTGRLSDLDRFNLMTAKSAVSKGEASFTFESHVAVVAIPAKEIMYNGTSATKVVLSGENFSSSAEVSIADGSVKVTPAGGSELAINSPSLENGYIFVAFVPTAGEVSVDLYDSIGGHFFCTIADAGSLSKGAITDLSGAGWDGGIEITFAPSVGAWN